MATAIATDNNNHRPQSKKHRPKRICFSFAAYAKTLIQHLKASNITIEQGLTDSEISRLESSLNFSFPPDLRSILQQGLPTSPGFPNWRSSSMQQLHLLHNLPIFSLLRGVSKNNFWHSSWGKRPRDKALALEHATRCMEKVPKLVPIYRKCYMASSPNLAGNPVFYVDYDNEEGEVRVLSNDVAGFFREAVVWAAERPRTVEFWSEVCGGGRWWAAAEGDVVVGECLERAWGRLREGGWREEEIRDMMSGWDYDDVADGGALGDDPEAVEVYVRLLSERLLSAGWSRDDVVYSLGPSALC